MSADDPARYWQARNPISGRHVKLSRYTGCVVAESDEPFAGVEILTPGTFGDALDRARSRPIDSTTPCGCWACLSADEIRARMILCPTCGNKRCPHATDHRLTCTGSNEPGQAGSVYGDRG